MDTIIYMMEVIARREKKQPTGKYTDVHIAWTSFSENYLPYIENNKSLYDDIENIKDKTDIRQKPLYRFSPSRKIQQQLRTAYIVAIVSIMLLVGTVTASALGFDLWEVVAQWTKDTFSFSNDIINKQSSDDLQETLDKYSINNKIAPKWLPKGYSFESVDVIESPMRTIINCIYSNKDDEILVTIIPLAVPSFSTYEKDDSDIIEYNSNGIEHYIMTKLKESKSGMDNRQLRMFHLWEFFN